MSIIQTISVACPSCSERMETDVFDSINADRRADLRDDILESRLQVKECPSCGAIFRLDPVFNYLDSGRGEWISAQPPDQLTEWVAEQARAQDVFDQAYGSGAPKSARVIGDDLSVRLVFGWSALREKLIARENGIDDVALELTKLAMIRSGNSAGLGSGDELRLTAVDEDALMFGWMSPDVGEVKSLVEAPRSLCEDIEPASDDWGDLRAQLTDGPFVDCQKFYIDGAADAAAN